MAPRVGGGGWALRSRGPSCRMLVFPGHRQPSHRDGRGAEGTDLIQAGETLPFLPGHPCTADLTGRGGGPIGSCPYDAQGTDPEKQAEAQESSPWAPCPSPQFSPDALSGPLREPEARPLSCLRAVLAQTYGQGSQPWGEEGPP